MRTIAFVLIAVSLLAIVPAAEARGPGGDCDVQEEYITEAYIDGVDPENPTANPVHFGHHTLIECYY